MKHYNYRENIKKDIAQYIKDNINIEDFDDVEDFKIYLAKILLIPNEITGEINNSYTNDSVLSEIFLVGNLSLLSKSLEYFHNTNNINITNILNRGAEYCDMIVRKYILETSIDEILNQIVEELQH